jgi:hypothetical protein
MEEAIKRGLLGFILQPRWKNAAPQPFVADVGLKKARKGLFLHRPEKEAKC